MIIYKMVFKVNSVKAIKLKSYIVNFGYYFKNGF